MYRHCGVWDAEAKRNCTRSLTCKSHSVYLKRKVPQRTGPFDDLLAAHKAAKEAEQAKSMEGEAEPSILQRRLAMPPGVPHTTGVLGTRVAWEPVTIATGTGENRVATLLKQIPTGANVKKPVIQLQQNQTNDFYTDENLHYTTGMHERSREIENDFNADFNIVHRSSEASCCMYIWR